MPKPATLLALLCILAACGSDLEENPQTTGSSGVEGAPSQPSSPLPAAQTSLDTTTAALPPADGNTTSPAATLEEAAPPPEP
jgi:hypothetical protein